LEPDAAPRDDNANTWDGSAWYPEEEFHNQVSHPYRSDTTDPDDPAGGAKDPYRDPAVDTSLDANGRFNWDLHFPPAPRPPTPEEYMLPVHLPWEKHERLEAWARYAGSMRVHPRARGSMYEPGAGVKRYGYMNDRPKDSVGGGRLMVGDVVAFLVPDGHKGYEPCNHGESSEGTDASDGSDSGDGHEEKGEDESASVRYDTTADAVEDGTEPHPYRVRFGVATVLTIKNDFMNGVTKMTTTGHWGDMFRVGGGNGDGFIHAVEVIEVAPFTDDTRTNGPHWLDEYDGRPAPNMGPYGGPFAVTDKYRARRQRWRARECYRLLDQLVEELEDIDARARQDDFAPATSTGATATDKTDASIIADTYASMTSEERQKLLYQEKMAILEYDMPSARQARERAKRRRTPKKSSIPDGARNEPAEQPDPVDTAETPDQVGPAQEASRRHFMSWNKHRPERTKAKLRYAHHRHIMS
jgi:hypothetical protein